LRNADAAMNKAQDGASGGFQFYAEAMTREALFRVEMEYDLRLALQRKELLMHYQPQIDLASGSVVGVEALMRWHYKGREWVSPAQFIPVAEESELIFGFGGFALLEACRQIADWDKEGLPPLRIAVNVSARQFHDPHFIGIVSHALQAAGLDPRRLEIEITESVLVEEQEAAIAILKGLKTLGVQVAVDDFGTGYSSLSYLSRLPVDRLKIDCSFVQRVTEHGRDATIAHAIISLAHSLGLLVIAEGIETTEQLAFLKAHGCDEGQGYLFAKPFAAEAMRPFIGKGLVR
jgi:EAL domain-containing protein (putative c-di-GMP-specific phosphodiesterase class I)